MHGKYSNNARDDLIAGFETAFGSSSSVIELGCADGSTLNSVAKKFNGLDVYGFDLHPAPGLHMLDIKRIDLNDESDLQEIVPFFEKGQLILLLDVLEHLVNPSLLMEFLEKEIHTGSKILVSLPNVRNWRVWFALVRNDWPSEDTGVFDGTHLHFFTSRSAVRFVSDYFSVLRFEFRFSQNPVVRLVQKVFPTVLCGQFSLLLECK